MNGSDCVTLDDVVDHLNKAFAADPEAVRAMFSMAVRCNDRLVEDTNVICDTVFCFTPKKEPDFEGQYFPYRQEEVPVFRALGLIGGLFVGSGRRLAGVYDDKNKLVGFTAVNEVRVASREE